MKTILIITGFFLLVSVALYCFKRAAVTVKNNTDSKDSVNFKKPTQNNYTDLRQMALDVPADKLGIPAPPDSETKAYGIVMDMDMGNGIATLVAYASGDASIYLSTGGGLIGAGQHESANKAARSFLLQAQLYLKKAELTNKTPLPDKGRVNFYFLTNKGKYVASDAIANFENETSPLTNLFYGGNAVITALRLTTEKKSR